MIAAITLVGCCMGGSAVIPLFTVDVSAAEFVDSPFAWVMPVVCLGFVLVAVVFALVGYQLLGLWRGGVWLDGTVLRVRDARRTVEVDLATAQARLETVPAVRRHQGYVSGHAVTTETVLGHTPALKYRAPHADDWSTLALNDSRGAILPRSQLYALAAAAGAGRHPDSPEARTAAGLRRLADEPVTFGSLPPGWPDAAR